MKPARPTRRKVALGAALIVCLVVSLGCQLISGPRATATPAPRVPPPTDTQVISTPTEGVTQEPTPTSPEKATPAATETLAPVVTLAPTAGTGTSAHLLFGPFHLPEGGFTAPFTGAFRGLQPSTALGILDAARASGFKVIIQLAGGRQVYQESSGAFSVTKFNQSLEAFRGIDFSPYVADGTLLGHMMFDEPFDPSNWNGAAVPYTDLETAAAYSKQLWPTLPVGVGAPPSFLAKGTPWSALDFGYAQYTTRMGEVNAWLKSEVVAANQAGLGIVVGINILGGNNRSPVTSAQLREWGKVLASEPAACGFLMWKYDPGYLQNPDNAAALAEIGKIAAGRSAPVCQR